MGVRLLEGGVALGFGAGDALVASKLTGTGPAGIPWSVLYEGAGIAIGIFGGKVGIDAGVRDTVLLSALGLAGARVARAAITGKLMSGPKAWGGDAHGGDYFGGYLGDTGGDYDAMGGASAGRSRVRMLPGARGGGFSVWPVSQEAPGVAG